LGTLLLAELARRGNRPIRLIGQVTVIVVGVYTFIVGNLNGIFLSHKRSLTEAYMTLISIRALAHFMKLQPVLICTPQRDRRL